MNKEAKSETRFAVTTQLLQMRHSRHSSPEIVHVTRANKKEAYPIRPVTAIVCTTKIATNSPTSPQAPASRVCHKYHRQLDLYSIAYTLRRKFNSRCATLPIALYVYIDIRGRWTICVDSTRKFANTQRLWRTTRFSREKNASPLVYTGCIILDERWKTKEIQSTESR